MKIFQVNLLLKLLDLKNKINKFDIIALSLFLPYFIQENLLNHGILAHLLMNVKIVLQKYGMKKEQ
jgi:hypothetical protein